MKSEWWQNKTPGELPMYVKEKCGNIWRVHWSKRDGKLVMTFDRAGKTGYYATEETMTFYQPATEHEFQEFLKLTTLSNHD